jgi:hypothetical protein
MAYLNKQMCVPNVVEAEEEPFISPRIRYSHMPKDINSIDCPYSSALLPYLSFQYSSLKIELAQTLLCRGW